MGHIVLTFVLLLKIEQILKLEKLLCYLMYSVSEKDCFLLHTFLFSIFVINENDSIISQRGLGFRPLQLLYFTVFYFILFYFKGEVM